MLIIQLPPRSAGFIQQCHTQLPAAEERKNALPFATEPVLLSHPTFTMQICATFLCGLTAVIYYKNKWGGEGGSRTHSSLQIVVFRDVATWSPTLFCVQITSSLYTWLIFINRACFPPVVTDCIFIVSA